MEVKVTQPLLPLRDIVVFPSMVIPLFVGRDKSITALNEVMKKDKKIISLFAGSRTSETNILLPILLNFIKLMNEKFNQYYYIFHAMTKIKI